MNLSPPGGLTDPGAIVLSVAVLSSLVVSIMALRRAIKSREALWYLIICFFPLAGAIITLAALDRSGKRRNSH